MKFNKSRCFSLNCAKASSVSVFHILCSFPAVASPNLGSSTGTCSAGRRQARVKTLNISHTCTPRIQCTREFSRANVAKSIKEAARTVLGVLSYQQLFPHLSSRPVTAHSCLWIQWKPDTNTTLTAPAGMWCLGREFSSY